MYLQNKKIWQLLVLSVKLGTMNTEFEKFIKKEGGIDAAMDFTGYSRSSVYKIRSGERKIDTEIAIRICEKYMDINLQYLLLPRNEAA